MVTTLRELFRNYHQFHAYEADGVDEIVTLGETWCKLKKRKLQEVLVLSGSSDQAGRVGMFGRAANPAAPHLNSREGHVRARRETSEGAYVDGEVSHDE